MSKKYTVSTEVDGKTIYYVVDTAPDLDQETGKEKDFFYFSTENKKKYAKMNADEVAVLLYHFKDKLPEDWTFTIYKTKTKTFTKGEFLEELFSE